VRLLRPLRLLVPLIAVGAALVVFLVFGFLAYQAGTGGGGVRAEAKSSGDLVGDERAMWVSGVVA